VDDLSRNFEMNRRNGVECSPYYHSEERREAKVARAARKAVKAENARREERGMKKVRSSEAFAAAAVAASAPPAVFAMLGSPQSGVAAAAGPSWGLPGQGGAAVAADAEAYTADTDTDTDCELLLLGAYLCSRRVLGSTDVTQLDHSSWRTAAADLLLLEEKDA